MKRRALFLDRDGVINEECGYVGTPDRFVFKDGIFDLLCAAQDKGYLLVVVTNQSGVARGMYTKDDHEALMRYMTGAFGERGIKIDMCLECYDLKEGTVPLFRNDSFWRKPSPGMLLEAIQRLRIDPAQSLMLGDKDTDMLAAKAAGVGTLLLMSDTVASCDRAKTVNSLCDVLAFL